MVAGGRSVGRLVRLAHLAENPLRHEGRRIADVLKLSAQKRVAIGTRVVVQRACRHHLNEP